ncbi:MAG TPA: hypothetical protein P5572_00310 [Phycisphaerae bacterium]|nr:hypothetical protein [Phycisphaerales bacterium]HRX83440.1 hypothetical protein [Phycisphaerae bacterium]
MSVLMIMAAGCEGTRQSLDPIFLTREETLDLARQAREASLADERRLAMNRLARSQYLGDDEVVEQVAGVARSDPSNPVRVAAVTALGHADTASACAYCAALLPRDDVALERFPAEEVRTEALAGLERCAANHLLAGKVADHAEQVGVRLLRTDVSRNARLAAARLLGYFPQRDVLDALIAALDQRDFAVCHAAELSLERLTGRAFDHNPAAWRQYVAAADDPFAKPAVASDKSDGGWFGWLSPDNK